MREESLFFQAHGSAWGPEFTGRSVNIEASEFSGGPTRYKGFRFLKGTKPLLLAPRCVERRGQTEPVQILLPRPSSPLQQFENPVRRESGILAGGRPHHGSQREDAIMGIQNVHVVPRFVPPGERKELVDRKVHVVKAKPPSGVPNDGHEPPCRIVGPVNQGLLLSSRNEGARVSPKREFQLHVKPRTDEEGPIGFEGLGDSTLRVMEEIQVLAVADGVRRRMKRGTSGQVALRRAIPCQESKDFLLERRQGHRDFPRSHASRSPCFMSWRATHATSSTPIFRSGG